MVLKVHVGVVDVRRKVVADAHWHLVEIEVHVDVEVVVAEGILGSSQSFLLLIGYFVVYLAIESFSCSIDANGTHRTSWHHAGDGLECVLVVLYLYEGVGDYLDGGAIGFEGLFVFY